MSLTLTQLERLVVDAVDMLRGEMEPFEAAQCTFVLLFLKRCSDVDERELRVDEETNGLEQPASKPFVVPPEARWNYLHDELRGDVARELDQAVAAFEERNPALTGTLSSTSFQRAGRAALSDEKLRRLIAHCGEYRLRDEDLDSPALLGEAYEAVFNHLAVAAAKKGAAFSTPPAIVRLMVRLADPQEGMRVYDPCAGTGGMLARAAKHVREHGGTAENLRIYGQEPSVSAWAVARLAMVLQGIDSADIRKGDTLADPLHLESGALMRFDRVLTNPPFAQNFTEKDLKFPERFAYGKCPEKKKADLMFVQHVLAVLAAGGMACAVLPLGALFRGGQEKEIRRGIIEDDLLEAVIGLGPNLFYGTAIPACIWVLRAKGSKPKKRNGKVLFIKADQEYRRARGQNHLEREHIDKIVSAYERFEDIEDFAAVYSNDELREQEYNLNLGRLVWRFYEKLADIEEKRNASSLGSLAKIVAGYRERRSSEDGPSLPCVSGRDIVAGGDRDLDVDALVSAPCPDDETAIVRENDILVSGFVTEQPRVVVVPRDADGKAWFTSSVLRVRLNEATPEMAEYVAGYLRSETGHRWVRECVESSTATAESLQRVPIVPPEPLLMRVNRELAATGRRLREVAAAFDKDARKLFADPAYVDQLRHAQHPIAQAAELGKFLDRLGTLSSIVRSAFPLPLALSWRGLEVQREPKAIYEATLRLAENVTAFLGAMLLADMRARGETNAPVLRQFLDDLSRKKGVKFGLWAHLLSQGPRLRDDALEESGFPELRQLVGNGDAKLWSPLRRLLDRRNDISSQRGPRSPREFEEAATKARADLEELFKELLFLARYPLRKIERVQYDELMGELRAQWRELRGDHELVPVERAPLDVRCEEGLYFFDKDSRPRLASPWLMFTDCPTCGHWEVYVPARPGKDGGNFRSLTTTHEHPVDQDLWSRLSLFLKTPARARDGAAQH